MFGALIILPEDDVEELLYADTYDVNEPDEIVMLTDWYDDSIRFHLEIQCLCRRVTSCRTAGLRTMFSLAFSYTHEGI